MRANTQAARLGGGLVWLVLVAPVWRGQEASGAAPPVAWRSLTPAQAKHVAQLDAQMDEAVEAGRFDEAVKLAQQMVALREKAQGKRHWEVVDARWELRRAEGLARLPRKDHQAVAAGLRRLGEGDRLRARRDPSRADRAYREALALLRRALGEKHPETALGYNNLAFHLSEQGKHLQAQPLYERALLIRRQTLGEEHPYTAVSYNNLASNLASQRKYPQAQAMNEKAVLIRRRTLGEYHPNTAVSCNNVAANLHAQRQYAQAQPLFEQALLIRRKALGEDHLETAVSCENLAFNLEAQGKHPLAQRWYEKALAISRKVLGEQHLETAQHYTNLAYNLHTQGKHALAQSHYEKALLIRRKELGEPHPDTAQSYHYLGLNLSAQRKYAQAQRSLESALRIRLCLLGEKHPLTVLTCNNVGANLGAQGKYVPGQAYLEKVLAIRRRTVGEQNYLTASAYGELAYNLYQQGNSTQAQRLHEKALAICLEVLGEWNATTATSYNNLAFVLQAQGKYAEAEPLYKKALAIRRKLLGDEDADTAQSYNTLASCLQEQGQHAQAHALHEKALAIFRTVLGEEHTHTASSYNYLASCLQAQGNYAQALPLREKALAVRRRLLGEEHPDTATSYNDTASCLEAQGQPAEAQALYEKGLAIRRKILGEGHSATGQSYNNVALCLGAQGKHAEAQRLVWRALEILHEALGEKHRDTATCYNNLAFTVEKLGQFAQAQPLYEKALAISQKVRGEEHAGTATYTSNLAFCLQDQGRHALAQPLFEKALAICRKVLGENHHLTATTCNNLAYNLYLQGKHAQAAPYWGTALLPATSAQLSAGSSGFERAIFRANVVSPGEALAICLARLDQPIHAWSYAEASLAGGLLADLDPSSQGLDLAPAHSERLRQVQHLLVPLLTRSDLPPIDRRRRDDLLRERTELLRALARQAAQRAARRVYSLERIQKQVPADTALVVWLRLGKEAWGCVVRHEGPPRWQRLPGSGARSEWLARDFALPARLYDTLVDPAISALGRDQLTAGLHKRWLAPLEPHLKAQGKLPSARRLLVVPIDLMRELPLEALTDRYTISYIPSGTVFAQLRERHRPLQGGPLLALGDPVFAARRFDPPTHGLLVRLVLPGSNAARAGLQSGDVLLRHGKRLLKSLDDLSAALAAGPAPLLYWRDGSEGAVRLPAGRLGVTLDKRPVAEAVKAWRQENNSLAQRGTGHKPLPGTRWEVQALAHLIAPTTTLLGSRASEQAIDELVKSGKLKEFRLVHLATHGEVNRGRPGLSALILAQDRLLDPLEQARQGKKVYKGRLTVQTIRTTWRLDADLVVLSACESGLGKDAGFEGLLGFAYALLAKGARSVVLSRWKVDDVATALLMVRFYENLLGSRKGTGPMPRADALAEAKRWLGQLSRAELEPLAVHLAGGTLRGTQKPARPLVKSNAPPLPAGDRPFAHPYYWAAFVLIGDPD
jgi:tetratricopeptide (TPR) repeat protein